MQSNLIGLLTCHVYYMSDGKDIEFHFTPVASWIGLV